MNTVEPRGAAHWIDHYVVGTNDLGAWPEWANKATGLPLRPINGITTTARKKNVPIFCFMWWESGSCRIGAFLLSPAASYLSGISVQADGAMVTAIP